MIRRSPCERYIKFLLVHPQGYSIEAVRDIVRGQTLDYPGDDYIEGLKDRLDPEVPSPFHPKERTHSRSQRFLSREQLLGFFIPDKSSLVAHKLLQRPRAKEMIEATTLAGEHDAFVSHRVRSLNYKCTPQAIKRYRHFYWDLELVDSTELRALLQMRVDHIVVPRDGYETSSDQRLQHVALRRASYKDPRRLIAEMPVTPMAGMLGQMRLGLLPSQIDVTKIANAARAAAAGRALEALVVGGPDDAARARDYAVTAKTLSELISELGSPDVELQRELHQLALATDEGQTMHVEQLPEGDTFTTELLPAEMIEGKNVREPK